MQTQELESRSAGGVKVGGEVFSFGVRSARISGAFAVVPVVAIALTFAFVPHSGGQTFWLLGGSFVLASLGWGWLSTAYEVSISPGGTVTWTSVLRTVEFPLREILGIVRRERASNGNLHSIRIEYLGGSVILAPDEAIFARFKALSSNAQLKHEEYDDSD